MDELELEPMVPGNGGSVVGAGYDSEFERLKRDLALYGTIGAVMIGSSTRIFVFVIAARRVDGREEFLTEPVCGEGGGWVAEEQIDLDRAIWEDWLSRRKGGLGGYCAEFQSNPDRPPSDAAEE